MVMSMRNLQSSSEEDEEEEKKRKKNTFKPTRPKPMAVRTGSHPLVIAKTDNSNPKKLEENNAETTPTANIYRNKSLDLPASNNRSLETVPTFDVSDTSKSALPRISSDSNLTEKNSLSDHSWLKGHVSESFKKISSRISPASSLDNSLDNSCEDGAGLSRSKDENPTPTIPPSKTQWFKGHLNNYLTKSKNYYAQQKRYSESEDDTVSPKPTQLTPSTMVTDECCIPVLQSNHFEAPVVSKKLTEDTKKQSENKPTVSTKQDEAKSDKHTTNAQRLTFSELLSAQKNSALNDSVEIPSPLSPKKESPTTNEVKMEIAPNEVAALAEVYVKEDLKDHLRTRHHTSVSYFKLLLCALILYPYFMAVYPTTWSGMITGVIIAYLWCCFSVLQLCPSAESVDTYRDDLKEHILKTVNMVEDVKGLPNPEVLQKPKDIKGWLQISESYEDYSIDKTGRRDAYVIVHENSLFLFTCQHNITEDSAGSASPKKISHKKLKGKQKKAAIAHADSQGPAFVFKHECHFDLSQCKLYLKPDDLPVRRMWSKKYPVKFCVPAGVYRTRQIDLTLEDLTLNLESILDGTDDSVYEARNEVSYNEKEKLFYLFGNTGREKEDWFYRLQLCVRPLKHQTTLQDIRRQRISNQPSKSYAHYMIELMSESEKVIQRNINGKKVEPYLAWLNVFIGRAFWDFWHEKYWTDKLHQKIQSRLSKINTPPFITDIKLKELDCGHNIPIIHKGSLPVLDDYGVWTDLQITYKGYFTLTLETQLNVDYYSGLVSGILKENLSKDTTKMSDLGAPPEDNYEDHAMEHDEIPDVYLDAFDSPMDASMEDDDPVMADPRTKAFLESKAGKKVVGVVSWLAKSRIAKRVAETEFARKAYGRACEKFRKMPIILRVQVQSVKGNLAVNIPPPPTNRLWFGFRGNPVIFITATPKVGEKNVRLTYLTSWIEKKLKEEFKKYLVLPAMQDLSIKLMDHQLSQLHPDRPETTPQRPET